MKNWSTLAFLLLLSHSLLSQMIIRKLPPPRDTIYPFDITLTTIDSTKSFSSKELLKNSDNKPTVLAFWLTTCFPCHMELETYTRNFEEWQKQADFRLIAISTDFPQRFQRIGQIVQEKKFPFEVYWDVNRQFSDVLPGGLNGLPQVFIFDKGKIVYHHRKFRPGDENELFAQIKSLSPKKGGSK